MVNRTVEITEGDILIGETSVRDRDPAELRREMGYVIQQIGLFPHRTVAQNIETVPRLLGWDHERTRKTGRSSPVTPRNKRRAVTERSITARLPLPFVTPHSHRRDLSQTRAWRRSLCWSKGRPEGLSWGFMRLAGIR